MYHLCGERCTMVSYWKTQWLRFVLGCVFMLISFHFMFVGKDLTFVVWAVSGLIYFISADLLWHKDCLKAMEKRIEALETRAITDIDKTERANHFVVRRRLGPDKDVPYPEDEKKDD